MESLKNSLVEETNVSAKQRIELERLKVELEKAKQLINKLKTADQEKMFSDSRFDLLSERDQGMVNNLITNSDNFCESSAQIQTRIWA